MRVKIASRKSDLARIQAFEVGNCLKEKFPQIEIIYDFKESLGDKNLSDPLWKMPEKGVFTEDFRDDLKSSRVDMVVHSWKDLPTEARNDTIIAATLPRADARDLFLFKKTSFEKLKKGADLIILSSSPRREYGSKIFLKSHLPQPVGEIGFAPVRGNVPTRLTKLLTEKADGLIVAKAAIDRILASTAEEFSESRKKVRSTLDQCLFMILPLKEHPPAAAQGALAVEILKTRHDLAEICKKINCTQTYFEATEERKILATYGGGCHQKIGVSVGSHSFGGLTSVQGERSSPVEKISTYSFHPSETNILPRTKKGRIFPESLKENAWFKRTKLKALDSKALEAKQILVAKVEAWPDSWTTIPRDARLWTAGTDTWRKIALKGLWISGCFESLGTESSRGKAPFQPLSGKEDWVKLSHDKAPTDKIPTLATYQLEALSPTPNLKGVTHFFWTSGSIFLRALELNPEIRDSLHSCGPGLTLQILQNTLGKNKKIYVFPSHANWLEYLGHE